MKKILHTELLVMSLGLLTGCASQPADAGFSAVQSTVIEKLGRRVEWNRMGGDDKAAADAVPSMLAKPLTVDEAIQIALLNNRELQAAFEDLGIAQADLIQAGLLKTPVFDTAVKFTNGSGTKLQFLVVENFLELLQIPLRKRLALAAVEQARLRVTGQVFELAGRVGSAFCEQQASEQLLELRRSVVEATSASFDLAVAETSVLNGRERLNVLMDLWGQSTQ